MSIKKSMQNREGLPDSIIEDRRFFELYGIGKGDTPAGWNNPAAWKVLDEIQPDRPFGFAIGNNSDYLFIDCDHVIDENGAVVPWVEAVLNRIFQTSRTYYEVSMSGTGLHFICDLADYADCFGMESNGYDQIIIQMDPDEYKTLPKAERDKVPKIEFFFHTDGRYVYLTGQHDELIEVARNEEAAAVFRELLAVREELHKKYRKNGSVEAGTGQRFQIDENTRKDVLEALPFISASARDTWVKVGIALNNCGFPFEVWDSWSQWADQRKNIRCDKYDSGETPKIWKSFINTRSNYNAGTIFILAKEAGWKSEAEIMAYFGNRESAAGAGAGAGAGSGTVNSPAVSFELPTMDDIEEKEPEWLIQNLIPLHSINIIAGEGGCRKSTVACAIAGSASAGKECFLDETGTPMQETKVMYFSGEEDPAYTLKKRIRMNGAKLRNILTMTPADDRFKNLLFTDSLLMQLIGHHRPGLVIFDPIQSFIPADIHMGDRNAIRSCMTPLLNAASKYGTTFLIVCHSNKRSGVWGRQRIADSADIWDVARCVLMAGFSDQKGTWYISNEKNSYAARQRTALFTVEDDQVTPKGFTDKTDRDFVMCTGDYERPAPARDEAKNLILDVLKDGEMAVKEMDEVVKSYGISAQSLRRAKEELRETGILKFRRESQGKGKGVKWFVSAPIPEEFSSNLLTD